MPGLCDTVLPEETSIVGNAHHTVRCHLYPGSTPSSTSIPSSSINVNGAG
jgi:peptide/nickel transport system ATP-binding protein